MTHLGRGEGNFEKVRVDPDISIGPRYVAVDRVSHHQQCCAVKKSVLYLLQSSSSALWEPTNARERLLKASELERDLTTDSYAYNIKGLHAQTKYALAKLAPC